MKKFIAFLVLWVLFFSTTAQASIQFSEDGTRKGQFRKVNLTDGLSINDSGDISLDTDVNIDGGTIDGTRIGASTAADATFTTAVMTNLGVTTGVVMPNTVTVGSRTGALPTFVGGVQGSPNKLFSVTTTIASGSTTSAPTITGLTSAARCVGTLQNEPTVPSVYVKSVAPGSGSATVSLSANPGTSGATVGVFCTEV